MINITPKLTINIIDKCSKAIIIGMVVTFILGCYYSFIDSPQDYQQGEYVRIMYVHVPSAWLALAIYGFMALFSFIYLVWKNPLFDLISKSAAPIGALFCFITLVTGSFWGRPVWGSWWVWDARLTSMLILFFFYLGYLYLDNLTEELTENKAAACLAVFGSINVPIVKFSVNLWNSLHQPASVFKFGGPSIHSSMLTPLLIMFVSFCLYFILNTGLNLKAKLIALKLNRSI